MDNSVIRNYTITVDKNKKKSTFKLYPYPVEVLTPAGWRNIEEEYLELLKKEKDHAHSLDVEEEKLLREYKELVHHFYEGDLAETIILDTDDPSGIEIVSRKNVPHVRKAEHETNFPHLREFAYVKGAQDISGVIILPYDDYSDVYLVSDSDEDGNAEITTVKTKEETDGVRPYYEKEEGKTLIYVNHFSGGGGTQADPYIVSNEDDLNNVRKSLNAWYVQDRDITMGKYQTGEGFTPIGTISSPFTGVYDGNGYQIKSLYMNTNTVYVGLFGAVEGATIQNIRLNDPNITGSGTSEAVGSLIGLGYNITINNCNVIGGTVTGNSCVGGVIGKAVANRNKRKPGVYMNYCYNYNCNVRGSDNYVGGMLGYAINETGSSVNVNQCFSSGLTQDVSVTQNKLVGGLIGATSSYFNSSGCYWDMEKSTQLKSAAGTGLSTADAKEKSSYESWDFDIYWHISQDYNEGYPEHRQFVRYKFGMGTEAEPFIITSEFDLNQMRWWRTGFYFRFEDDINMKDHQTDSGFYPIGWDITGKVIGGGFNSIVDGGGHCIYNLYINRFVNEVGLFGVVTNATIKNLEIIDCNIIASHFCSPFGIITNSTISNCHVRTINSCKITGSVNTAGFASVVHNRVKIEDCSTTINVIAVGTNSGGFVGGVKGTQVEIRRCFTAGRIESSTGYVGGFFGVLDPGGTVSYTIEDCYSEMDVIGTSGVGGFGGNVYHSHNTPSYIRRCIVKGRVQANSTVNAFVNTNSTPITTTFKENYFDNQFLTTTTVTGAVGKLTAELKHPSTYDSAKGWDFENVWVLDERYNEGYPALRSQLPIEPPLLGFRNEYGKYYVDNYNNILRYLEFGTLVASQTGLPKAVWLQNNADFSVNNLKVFIDENTVAEGMKVELSTSETPFIPVEEIIFNGTFAKGTSAKFYIRLGSDIKVKTGGTFDLRAKASPV